MATNLDLDDIQGNVIRAYGKFGYPKARYFFLNLTNAWVGRKFTEACIDKITTARRWEKVEDPTSPSGFSRKGPDITMNMGFTFMGLYMMDLPTRTLSSMPDEFIDGMKKRAFVLGDRPSEAVQRMEHPVLPTDAVPSWMEGWDPIWKDNRQAPGAPNDVHIWISLNAKVQPGTQDPVLDENGEDILEARTRWLRETCYEVSRAYYTTHNGEDADFSLDNVMVFPKNRGIIRILTTNGKNGDQEYQSASAVFKKAQGPAGEIWVPTPNENFGLADGIGDPVFAGQYEPDEMLSVDAEGRKSGKVLGRGKWMDPEVGWEPLATGEFLLGYPDESQELPPAARPPEFSQNGSFMAYRKLHQNVGAWKEFMAEQAALYAAQTPYDETRNLTQEEAEQELIAKMIGRWTNGVPTITAGTYKQWEEICAAHDLPFPTLDDVPVAERGASLMKLVAYLKSSESSDFKYAHDMQGYDCPNSSHLRRVNTRDYLDPQNNPDPNNKPERGMNENANTSLNKRRRIMRRGLPYFDPSVTDQTDETEQGVAMMVICANLFRQFEFVQQQWIQYGLDFNAGNNTCPLVGSHSEHKRFTVPADVRTGRKPFFCDALRNFVEPKGGEYFFIPSMTALRMIADGSVDPT